MSALYVPLIFLAAMLKFWLLWIVVAGLMRAEAEKRVSPHVRQFGLLVVAYGLVWDVLCNIFICTVLFLDLPREPTFSQRLRRLVTGRGWRQRLALWFAVNLINPFSADRNDPHITIPSERGAP